MIARWMLSATLFAALCGIAALASERALRAFGRPARSTWAFALACSATWPIIAPLFLRASHISVSVGTPIAVGTVVVMPQTDSWFNLAWLAQLDRAFVICWCIASALLLTQMMLAIRTLHRVQRDAQRTVVDGHVVLIIDSFGPAVLGLVHPTIVIPAWLLELDDALRALVLRHEREHCLARDPGLVWLTVVTTTLLPWNVALWWIAQRLRLAMEVDCDARTLRSDGDRTQYARLLLLIAQRTSSARFVPMLATAPSQLSRRIFAMQSAPVRHPARRAAFAGVIATLAIAAACSPRIASNFTAPAPEVATAEPVTVSGSGANADTSPSDELSMQPATMARGSQGPRYPDALRAAKVGGTVVAMFVVNGDGSADTNTYKVLKSTHAEFTIAVKEALATMRFNPAQRDGTPVRQLLQQVFQFDPSMSTATALTPTPPSMDKPTPMPSGTPFFEFQVERAVTMRAGSLGPKYPKSLKDAKVEGTVLAQFVVDTTGAPEPSTFKVLKSSNPLFDEAVRDALAQMQFIPAMVGGRPVKQLLQQPFLFSLKEPK